MNLKECRMNLEELIKKDCFETKTEEFKQRLDEKEPLSWLKSIAAFANTDGGTLYLGVKDKTSELTGYSKEEVDKEILFFNNQVNQHVSPKPNFSFSYLPFLVKNKKRYIIEIKIEKSPFRPVIVKFQGYPMIFVRGEGQVHAATVEEINNMVLSSEHIPFDLLPTNIKFKKEDFSKLFSRYKETNKNKTLTEKELYSIGFIDDKGFLRKGALLFKDNYNEDLTEIKCAKWPGLDKGSSLILSMEDFHGNLLDEIAFMTSYIEKNQNNGYLKTKDGRKRIHSFPKRSILEGVVNAIAHRNYYINGSQIQIDIFSDRLEITSPGSLVSSGYLNHETNIADIKPRRRNGLICSILSKIKLMEQRGTGFDKIESDYEKSQIKPYIDSNQDYFTLVLPDLTFDSCLQNFPKNENKVVVGVIENEGKNDKKILSYCYDDYKTIKEIASILSIQVSSYLRKEITNLVNQRYLVLAKRGNAEIYKTNNEKVELL